MVDELTPAEPHYSGPRCPSCQSPTNVVLSDLRGRLPVWLVCAQGRHLIRIRDAQVQGERGEYRPNALGANAINDGMDDPRGKAYWDAVYAAEGPQPPRTIPASPGS